MRIRADQLSLESLAPVYIVAGDEPLLTAETADRIRGRARESGCSERIVHYVEPGFDWSVLSGSASTLPLFAEKRLIELRMPTAKPGDVGGKTLQQWRSSADSVLLVLTGRLDAAAQRSKWLQALEAQGVLVQVWPLERSALPAWIRARMRAKGIDADNDVVALLAERAEGNLLACAQDIERLKLLLRGERLTLEQVADAIADSARFDVFALADAVLGSDLRRAVRILDSLKAEGVEPVLVLWALSREFRTLARLTAEVGAGQSVEALLQREHVWTKRKGLYRAALKRAGDVFWRRRLQQAAGVDRVIKGAAGGAPWEELLELVIRATSRPASASHPAPPRRA